MTVEENVFTGVREQFFLTDIYITQEYRVEEVDVIDYKDFKTHVTYALAEDMETALVLFPAGSHDIVGGSSANWLQLDLEPGTYNFITDSSVNGATLYDSNNNETEILFSFTIPEEGIYYLKLNIPMMGVFTTINIIKID
jgi:ABC-type oligopeptide transport system substrate-binding subunit